MTRSIIIAFLIIIAALLIFEASGRNAGAQTGAQSVGSFGQILKNQQLILQKLDAMDKKLDQLKMRIRL